MIINGHKLFNLSPIKDMTSEKHKEHGVSWGLSEVGYDIRIKQEIRWYPPDPERFIELSREMGIFFSKRKEFSKKYFHGYTEVIHENGNITTSYGRTALASSVEEFQLPVNLWGELRNKSTHARRFIDATIGTDMEPGWNGFLTIELLFHGNEPIIIPANSGILKAVFHGVMVHSQYEGKYQNQENKPIPAILEVDIETGPVLIIDGKGVYPENLDKIGKPRIIKNE